MSIVGVMQLRCSYMLSKFQFLDKWNPSLHPGEIKFQTVICLKNITSKCYEKDWEYPCKVVKCDPGVNDLVIGFSHLILISTP